MAASRYVLIVEKPGLVGEGWTFPKGYFPRNFAEFPDALSRAQEVIKQGGNGITILDEKTKTTRYRYDIEILPQSHLPGCRGKGSF